MKLLIDIPDEVGNEIRNSGTFCYEDRFNGKTLVAYMHKAIKEGVVFPKHGRLIDADDIVLKEYEHLEIDFKDYTDLYNIIAHTINEIIEKTPTIIEADKGE